jgi:TraX protein
MTALAESRVASYQVDNTDLLKTAAILLVALDHFAIYFVESQPLENWLEVFGRLAAPVFFFLIGFAAGRTVPIRWLVLGCILTVLGAWGDDWDWGPGSILFSFALFRLARPYFRQLVRESWIGAIFLVACFVVASTLPPISDYIELLALDGASGWLWALVGLCQREFVDAYGSDQRRFAIYRWFVAMITVCVFWLQTVEYWKEEHTEFTTSEMGMLAIGLTVLALVLIHFRRGPSPWQPGETTRSVLRFLGRHTLEIYAAQL